MYRLLADHGQAMFGDDYFADLYSASVKGQPTVPAVRARSLPLSSCSANASAAGRCSARRVDVMGALVSRITIRATVCIASLIIALTACPAAPA